MPETLDSAAQHKAEADVEKFRDQLGPFVVAAEKTRMAMVFTNAAETENPIVFANDAFLKLTDFARNEVLGASFKSLMTQGIGSTELAKIEIAFAGRADSEPEICYQRGNGTNFWASVFISPVCDEQGKIVQHFISLIDTSQQREKQAHCEMLIDELNHRVKNTLATVQSITRQALRGSSDPAVIREAIESRIFALARSHDLLSHEHWQGAELHQLVAAALRPFQALDGVGDRFEIGGPDVRLAPKATLALGIALHELATNAVKYGALSNDHGVTSVTWRIAVADEARQLTLDWRERGGPAVGTPVHRGFGSQVLQRGLSHELHGTTELHYRPGGVEFSVTIPLPGNNAHE